MPFKDTLTKKKTKLKGRVDIFRGGVETERVLEMACEVERQHVQRARSLEKPISPAENGTAHSIDSQEYGAPLGSWYAPSPT